MAGELNYLITRLRMVTSGSKFPVSSKTPSKILIATRFGFKKLTEQDLGS